MNIAKDNSLPSYMLALSKKYLIYFIALGTIALFGAIFQIATDFKVKEIIDTIATDKTADIALLLLLFVFYKFMQHGVYFIQRLLDIRYRPKILVETISNMYTETVQHSLHWFDSHLSGEISNKITDFNSSINDLIDSSFRALDNVCTIIIVVLFLLKVNMLSAGVIVLFVLIYTPILSLLLRKQMVLQHEVVKTRQETVGIINDSIANISGIKIIGNIWTEFKLKLTPSLFRWRDGQIKARKFDAYFVDNADTLLITLLFAAQIYLSAYLYQHDMITAGDFAFIALVTMSIGGALDAFLDKVMFGINPAIASLKSSYAFINATKDTQDIFDAKTLPRVRGDIKFEDVSFAYSDTGRLVLDHLNLHIQSGQRIGIVGTSGAGKTTLIKCLLRYFDVKSGCILIDDLNIADYTQESLRANISVIPQDITMFHRSIFENLQLAKFDATIDEVIEACKKARVHEDIMRMPQGYDSIVGERGVKVSGGQRQRIAIARAILKNAPILILDEATSALDTPTEKLIQESLNELLETNHLTNIVIAHRLSTLLHMDRILVFEHGHIIEDGTHSSLIAENGLYKTLWDAQVGGFIPEIPESE